MPRPRMERRAQCSQRVARLGLPSGLPTLPTSKPRSAPLAPDELRYPGSSCPTAPPPPSLSRAARAEVHLAWPPLANADAPPQRVGPR
eukprot:6895149-Pyramimonas_sp.AAC.1